MVVKSNLKTDIEALDGLEVFLEDIGNMAFEIGERVFNTIKDPLLNELQFYPPVPPNSKYKRTYKLRRGWGVFFIRPSASQFTMTISNEVKYTQWVVGSLAINGQRFQRDFHKANGWFQANKTSDFWFNAFNEDFAKEFNAELGEFAKSQSRKRAVTRL